MVPRPPEGSTLAYQARDGRASNAASSQTLTSDEAAEYIGFSPSWMRQSRMSGRVEAPPFLRFGRAIRYLRADLDRWLERRRCSPGCDSDSVQPAAIAESSSASRRRGAKQPQRKRRPRQAVMTSPARTIETPRAISRPRQKYQSRRSS
jgi:predicted DNA-binding transcriptional regulator AlpA